MSLRAAILKRLIGVQIAYAMRPDDPLERRARIEAAGRHLKPPGDVVTTPVDAGGVKAEWLSSPTVDPGRVHLHLHGGAYYTGSLDTHRELASRIGRAARMRSLLIDYRLAPEAAFPRALEDAAASYRWLLSEGFEPARLVVTGDSSGGGLAVALLVKLRDAGDPLPAGAVLFSPWLDLALTGTTLRSNARRDPINRLEYLEMSSRLYAAGNDLRNPLISPLYAPLGGLPPLLVQVGTDEVLLDDSVRFAARAKEAGVQVTLDVYKGMFHEFQMSARFLPEGRRAIEAAGEFIRSLTPRAGA